MNVEIISLSIEWEYIGQDVHDAIDLLLDKFFCQSKIFLDLSQNKRRLVCSSAHPIIYKRIHLENPKKGLVAPLRQEG